MKRTGLLHLYYGDGKGKTTAAMGLALRAMGSGKRVVILQFLKGGKSGEVPLLEQLGAKVYRGKAGQKFVFQMNEAEKEATRQLQNANLTAAMADPADLLILDEATSGLDPVIRDDILDMLLDFVQDEEHSILVSSHITSDLEKIADYIVFIHEGKVVFSKPKDELIEQYGVIKCGVAQFDALDKSDIITYRKMDYEWQILVSERDKIQKKYPKALIVPATIDEIMLLYVKGER